MTGEPTERDGSEPTEKGDGNGKLTRKLGRRALMLGAATGAGAAAALVAGASPTGAANGDTVKVGGSFTGTDATEITNTHGTGIYGTSAAASGITGYTAGVLGGSDTNSGVVGLTSASGNKSPMGGVVGVTNGTDSNGVCGVDAGGAGSGAGVFGESLNNIGIWGSTVESANPHPAVQAESGGTGSAVFATTTANATSPAVQSYSGSAQPAVQATGKAVPAGGAVTAAGNGAALEVQGVATFTRSGVKTIPVGVDSVVVAVPGGLTSTSHVLATMQNQFAAVIGAVPDTRTGKVTIYLDGTSSTPGMKVAWFVFG